VLHEQDACGQNNSGAATIDPVCGMTVDPGRAAGSHTHNGTVYHFCSTHCLEKFQAAPDKFIDKPTGKFIDPICGMSVDASSPIRAERDGQTYYFCCENCRQKFLGQTGSAGTPPLVQLGLGGSTSPAQHAPSACCHTPHAGAHGHAGTTVQPSSTSKYFCPMCPGVESDKPGDCPVCGMALERNPAWGKTASGKTIYTCPMHPEVQQDAPGDCPICGMPLEPLTATAETDEDDNAELRDMTRRLWIAGLLTLPVFVLAMAHLVPSLNTVSWTDSHASRWLQFVLSTPVVVWAGWPFFRRGWRSLWTGNLNMFTLIAIGVGAAYLFSAVAMLLPGLFPQAMQHDGKVGIYFEAAAVIIVLVLLGQVLELRPQPNRDRNSGAAGSGASHGPSDHICR